MTRAHHRPTNPGATFFESLAGAGDPAQISEAADLAATTLVRGVDGDAHPEVVQRIVRLADEEGLETLAELWAGSPAESLAGCLWRLYVIQAWVRADAVRAAQEFEAGRTTAQVARVVAGVADPPGPEQVQVMIDSVLTGIATRDFADVLFRAAAFAHVVAVGRAHLGVGDAQRMLLLAEQLESAGQLELAGALG